MVLHESFYVMIYLFIILQLFPSSAKSSFWLQSLASICLFTLTSLALCIHKAPAHSPILFPSNIRTSFCSCIILSVRVLPHVYPYTISRLFLLGFKFDIVQVYIWSSATCIFQSILHLEMNSYRSVSLVNLFRCWVALVVWLYHSLLDCSLIVHMWVLMSTVWTVSHQRELTVGGQRSQCFHVTSRPCELVSLWCSFYRGHRGRGRCSSLPVSCSQRVKLLDGGLHICSAS